MTAMQQTYQQGTKTSHRCRGRIFSVLTARQPSRRMRHPHRLKFHHPHCPHHPQALSRATAHTSAILLSRHFRILRSRPTSILARIRPRPPQSCTKTVPISAKLPTSTPPSQDPRNLLALRQVRPVDRCLPGRHSCALPRRTARRFPTGLEQRRAKQRTAK